MVNRNRLNLIALFAIVVAVAVVAIGLPTANFEADSVSAQYNIPEVDACVANAELQLRGLRNQPWYGSPDLSGAPAGFFPDTIFDQKYLVCDISADGRAVEVALPTGLVWTPNTGNLVPRWWNDQQG